MKPMASSQPETQNAVPSAEYDRWFRGKVVAALQYLCFKERPILKIFFFIIVILLSSCIGTYFSDKYNVRSLINLSWLIFIPGFLSFFSHKKIFFKILLFLLFSVLSALFSIGFMRFYIGGY
jgi:hypothetical protein